MSETTSCYEARTGCAGSKILVTPEGYAGLIPETKVRVALLRFGPGRMRCDVPGGPLSPANVDRLPKRVPGRCRRGYIGGWRGFMLNADTLIEADWPFPKGL